MKRTQKRKLRKSQSRKIRVRKYGGLKTGCSGYMIDCYIEHLLRLIKSP